MCINHTSNLYHIDLKPFTRTCSINPRIKNLDKGGFLRCFFPKAI